MEDIIWRNKNKWEYNLDKLKSFVSEESRKYTCKKELCKAMGVYKDFLDNVQKKEKIEFEYNFVVLPNNTNYKAIYQDYNWCYQKYVIERKSYQEMADELGVTKRVIQKWCVEKHGIHNNVMRGLLKPNKEQESLILGSLLGELDPSKESRLPPNGFEPILGLLNGFGIPPPNGLDIPPPNGFPPIGFPLSLIIASIFSFFFAFTNSRMSNN